MTHTFLNYRLDVENRTLTRDGTGLKVEPKAFDLLVVLLRNSDRVVGRQELLDSVWSGVTVSDASIKRCVMVARQAIGDTDPDNRIIASVHGRGFRFMAPVSRLDGGGTPHGAATTASLLAPAASVPLPTGAFAGRVEELRSLTSAWQAARGGRRQVALIAGDPGIGKTRLSMEAAAQAQAEGALVLIGRCDDELAVPFQPFIEILDQFLLWCPQASRASILGRHAAELQRLIPDLAELLPGLPPPTSADAETERFRLFAAMADWLRELTNTVATVFILDDLHWATKETGLLLRHLLRSGGNSRLFVMVTYRDTDVLENTSISDLLADIQREDGVHPIALQGLDLQSVGALLAAAAGEGHSREDLAAEVHRYAQGNVLFVSEIIRHLRESGRLANPRIGALQIPKGVRATVQRRVRHLPQECRELLSWACVMGADFSASLLATAAGKPVDFPLLHLDPACQARLLEARPEGTYRFAHRLVRDALYQELAPGERSLRHRRVGEAMEATFAADLSPHLGALAFHFSQAAGSGEHTKALDYCRRAGATARSRLAYGQAATHFSSALQLLSPQEADTVERLELLISLGEAQRDGGTEQYRETLLEAAQLARKLGNADALARAALANSQGWAAGIFAHDDQRIDTLEAALDAVGPGDSVARARLLANLMGELSFSDEPQRLHALDEEAMGMAERLGDAGTLSHVLRLRALSRWTPDLCSARRALSLKQLALAEQLANPLERWWGLNRCFCTAIEHANYEDAEQRLRELHRLTEDLGQPSLLWHIRHLECVWAQLDGDLEKAETIASDNLKFGESMGRTDATSFYIIQLNLIRLMQGRVEEHLPMQRVLIESGSAAGVIRSNHALALAETGHHDEAREIIEAYARQGFSRWPFATARLSGLIYLSRAAFLVGMREAAVALYELMLPWAGQVGFNGISMTGTVDACLAILAVVDERFDDADVHFAAAQSLDQGIRSSYWGALTLVDWATAMARRRNPRRSQELASRALDVATRYNFQSIVRRSREILDGQAVLPQRRRGTRV